MSNSQYPPQVNVKYRRNILNTILLQRPCLSKFLHKASISVVYGPPFIPLILECSVFQAGEIADISDRKLNHMKNNHMQHAAQKVHPRFAYSDYHTCTI